MSPAPAPRYSLVIPAYNEEKRIAYLFESITQFDGELIVVCDGSDRTADVVETIAKNRPSLSIRCLRFSTRLGKGGGVIAGLAAAQAPLVGYLDADGSTGIDEICRLFGELSSFDAVIGSRWVPGSQPRSGRAGCAGWRAGASTGLSGYCSDSLSTIRSAAQKSLKNPRSMLYYPTLLRGVLSSTSS